MRLASTFPLLLTSSLALAQCPFTSVSTQSYGQGCNPVFATNPTLAVALDAASCRVQLTVNAFPGCCNTFLRTYLLAIGFQQASIPVPQIGPGCTVLVQPTALLIQPSTAGATFSLGLPPIVPPLGFVAQGAAHYFTTIGFSDDFALTDGAQVTLQ
jgi:hypothetical protein